MGSTPPYTAGKVQWPRERASASTAPAARPIDGMRHTCAPGQGSSREGLTSGGCTLGGQYRCWCSAAPARRLQSNASLARHLHPLPGAARPSARWTLQHRHAGASRPSACGACAPSPGASPPPLLTGPHRRANLRAKRPPPRPLLTPLARPPEPAPGHPALYARTPNAPQRTHRQQHHEQTVKRVVMRARWRRRRPRCTCRVRQRPHAPPVVALADPGRHVRRQAHLAQRRFSPRGCAAVHDHLGWHHAHFVDAASSGARTRTGPRRHRQHQQRA